MRASIGELLEQARERAKQYLVALFAASPLHEALGTKLVPFGTIPIGERGDRYELHVFPAITHHMPLRGKPILDLVFAVFSPTGTLRELRDDEEENGKPGAPNRACTKWRTISTPARPTCRTSSRASALSLCRSWQRASTPTSGCSIAGTQARQPVRPVVESSERKVPPGINSDTTSHPWASRRIFTGTGAKASA